MATIFLRQCRFSYINTPEMKSPQVRGYEEVWQDNQRQVTYWDNDRVYRQRIFADSETIPSSVFSTWPMSDWRDSDGVRRLSGDAEIMEAEIGSSKSAMRRIAAGIKNWWHKAANQTEKLGRRLKSALRAAHKELTRPD